MNKFSLKTKVLFGNRAISELKNLNGGKFFIFADPFIVSSGMINRVTDELSGKDYRVFSKIVPDPPLETVAEGIKEIGEYGPDCVLAVGGGSAIDTAKAVMLYGETEQILFVAVPTTSGTGSEVTSFSVISDRNKGIKYPLVSDGMVPDIAVLDADFVKSVPPSVVADTGIDVLSHAIEAYVSAKANDFTDAFCEKSISLLRENLVDSYKGKADAKEKMHTASLMAGIAFNGASLGLAHALAHNIGAAFHIPHGRINGILLPEVIRFNSGVTTYTDTDCNECAKRYAKLAKLFGVGGGNVKMLVRGLEREIENLLRMLKMPLKLKDANIEITDLKSREIADGTLKDICVKTNPVAPTKEDVIKIINNIRE